MSRGHASLAKGPMAALVCAGIHSDDLFALFEPLGGAHRHPEEAVTLVGDAIAPYLDELVKRPLDELLTQRYAKFRRMGEAAIVDPNKTTHASSPN